MMNNNNRDQYFLRHAIVKKDRLCDVLYLLIGQETPVLATCSQVCIYKKNFPTSVMLILNIASSTSNHFVRTKCNECTDYQQGGGGYSQEDLLRPVHHALRKLLVFKVTRREQQPRTTAGKTEF